MWSLLSQPLFENAFADCFLTVAAPSRRAHISAASSRRKANEIFTKPYMIFEKKIVIYGLWKNWEINLLN